MFQFLRHTHTHTQTDAQVERRHSRAVESRGEKLHESVCYVGIRACECARHSLHWTLDL